MNRKIEKYIIKFICCFLGILTVGITLFLFIYIFYKGKSVMSLKFLSGYPEGLPLGTAGGIYPAIIGSLMSGILSALIGGLIGIGAALYLSFYNNKNIFARLVKLSVLGLSGIPSILFGLVAYVFLIFLLGMPRCILCSSIEISVMMIPFIAIRAKKIFDEKGKEYMKSSMALGISREYAIVKLIIPDSLLDLISTVALAMTFGMGATAPILYTGAVMVAGIPKSLTSPYMSLPYHLYMLVNNGFSLDYAYGTAFVLLAILLIIHFLTKILYVFKRK